MIVSTIDIYQDTTTRDKLIFPSAITHILTHLHVTIPLSPLFYSMGAINKESIRKNDAQLAAKRPLVEPTPSQQEKAKFRAVEDATYASRPSSSSAPTSSSGVEASFATIMDQLRHMRTDFGSCLDHISNEMYQMNTKIGCIACRQSCLGGFVPSPSPEPIEDSFGGDEGDYAFGSSSDDEMTFSQ